MIRLLNFIANKIVVRRMYGNLKQRQAMFDRLMANSPLTKLHSEHPELFKEDE